MNSTFTSAPLADRTWPRPRQRWVMRMNWHDLLFMHYRVDLCQLRPLIPKGLEIDQFDGSAWLGIVPFRMTGVAPRYSPSWPWLSAFPELNVRTYVTHGGKPGVWFFSLDATNPVAVRLARRLFHLPYMDADIELKEGEASCHGNWISYESHRTHRGELAANLSCEYRPLGASFCARAGTLEGFLTARYCLYSADSKGRIYRGEIDHAPWELREAQAIVTQNTMADWLGIHLPDQSPVLHFSRKIRTNAWPLQPVDCAKLKD